MLCGINPQHIILSSLSLSLRENSLLLVTIYPKFTKNSQKSYNQSMISLKELPNTLSIAQKYFIERSLELVNSKTIDTYRARLHNPKTILQELHQVLIDWDKNKLKRFETAKLVIDESSLLLKNEKELIFSSIDKEYYVELLTTTNDKQYQNLIAATQIVLNTNADYVTSIFEKTKEEIDSCNQNHTLQIHDLINLERLTSFLITELLSIGYSKTYLNNSIFSIFAKNTPQNTYDRCFQIFSQLKDKEEEEFNIVFKLIIPKEDLRNQLVIIQEDKVGYNQTTISELTSQTNDHGRKFMNISENFSKHLLIKVKSKDYYTVIDKAKEKLSDILDRIFLGYNQPNIRVYKEALVIGTRRPERAKSNPVNYRIFGSYISNQNLYETLQNKLSAIFDNPLVSNDTKQKIKSSIRYLRLGNDSTELEQKFLNYWIGLEFVFATSIKDISSFSRLIENFPNSHQLIYYKRNIREFHEDIKRLKVNDDLAFFHDDYSQYLNVEANYDSIKDAYLKSRPILSFRAYQLKRTLFQTDRRINKIKDHRKDLEWNLARIYRIRNEIIHEAALKPNISRISSHVRYYLTFVTINVIEYLSDSPIDINSDRQITIDDFFILQRLLFESNKKKGFLIKDIFKIKNPVEIFNK